jgi:hypothetical protein
MGTVEQSSKREAIFRFAKSFTLPGQIGFWQTQHASLLSIKTNFELTIFFKEASKIPQR